MTIGKAAAKRIATVLGWEPKREWVGLTDEEFDDCYKDVEWNEIDWCPDHEQLMRAVEKKLKEKNT